MDEPDSDGDSVMVNEENKNELEDYKCERPGVYNL